jgi:hypothetical protein
VSGEEGEDGELLEKEIKSSDFWWRRIILEGRMMSGGREIWKAEEVILVYLAMRSSD